MVRIVPAPSSTATTFPPFTASTRKLTRPLILLPTFCPWKLAAPCSGMLLALDDNRPAVRRPSVIGRHRGKSAAGHSLDDNCPAVRRPSVIGRHRGKSAAGHFSPPAACPVWNMVRLH